MIIRYLISDNKWIKEGDSGVCKDITTYTNMCMAGGLKHILLGKAIRESSDLELVHFDPLTNKLKKYTHLSVPENFLPSVMLPLAYD